MPSFFIVTCLCKQYMRMEYNILWSIVGIIWFVIYCGYNLKPSKVYRVFQVQNYFLGRLYDLITSVIIGKCPFWPGSCLEIWTVFLCATMKCCIIPWATLEYIFYSLCCIEMLYCYLLVIRSKLMVKEFQLCITKLSKTLLCHQWRLFAKGLVWTSGQMCFTFLRNRFYISVLGVWRELMLCLDWENGIEAGMK